VFALGLSLLGVAVVRAARWWSRRVDSLGRRNAFPMISVGLCVLLSCGALGNVALHRHTEHRLAAAAGSLAGTTVSVHCQTFAEAWMDVGPELGLVPFGPDGVPEHRTLIKWDTCRKLAGWLHSDHAHPSLDQVIAVHVLTHESMHMAGTQDEAVTECRATQRDVRMAMLLGATHRQARALAATYWREVYPRMTDGYRAAACAPGGSLDEHLPDAPWN
jgi:hypothetical protein